MIYLYPLDKEAAIEFEERLDLLPVLQQSTVLPVKSEISIIEPILGNHSGADVNSYQTLARPSSRLAVDVWAPKSSSASITSKQNGLASSRALSPALPSSESRDHDGLAVHWRKKQKLFDPESKPRPYRYRYLRPWSIRILYLHPSSNLSDAIVCSFAIHDIESDECSYDAVSHVWGPEGEIITIQIADGGRMFPIVVRPNLERALRQIRSASHKIALWVDALCIDQRNYPEKREQIDRMPMIFARASEVIVWLGDGNDDTEMAMKLIPQLVDLMDFDRLLKSDETPVQWQALVKLLEHPYFSRRWVFLEVILAKRAVVRCGTQRVPWEDLCDAVLLLGSRFEDIQFLCKRYALTQEYVRCSCLSHPLTS
jgi:hypothetical protein